MQDNGKGKWFINQVIDACKGKINIHPYEKLILIALASYAAKDGYCYPSLQQLENFTGILKNHLNQYLKTLKKLEIISVKRKYDKGIKVTRNFYKINIKAILEIRIENGEVLAKLSPESDVELTPITEQKVNQSPERCFGQDLNQSPERGLGGDPITGAVIRIYI